jgi:hypothetical protein
MTRSDLLEITLSVVPWFLFLVLVCCLIMAAPSLDQVVWGR